MPIQELDPWVPSLELEVIEGMLDLANLRSGETHVDLGSGDGRVMKRAIARGALSVGYEINPTLVTQSRTDGLTIHQNDLFNISNQDVRRKVITAWFTVEPGVTNLLTLLYSKMLIGNRFVLLYTSAMESRGKDIQGNRIFVDKSIPEHTWRPVNGGVIFNNKFYLYVKA